MLRRVHHRLLHGGGSVMSRDDERDYDEEQYLRQFCPGCGDSPHNPAYDGDEYHTDEPTQPSKGSS